MTGPPPRAGKQSDCLKHDAQDNIEKMGEKDQMQGEIYKKAAHRKRMSSCQIFIESIQLYHIPQNKRHNSVPVTYVYACTDTHMWRKRKGSGKIGIYITQV